MTAPTLSPIPGTRGALSNCPSCRSPSLSLMASRSSQNANSAVRTQPDGNGLVGARGSEAVAKAHRHHPPVAVELLEGEGQQQRHCPAPGTLEADEGLLQRVCYFIKAPCPL